MSHRGRGRRRFPRGMRGAAVVLRAAVSRIAPAALVLVAFACRRTEVVQSFPESFVGVGLELRMQDDKPVVVRALPGGPAAVAGVLAGDVLTDVDNRSLDGLSLGDVVMRLRGRPDTQVTIGVARASQRVMLVLRRQAMTKGAADYRPATAPKDRPGG